MTRDTVITILLILAVIGAFILFLWLIAPAIPYL